MKSYFIPFLFMAVLVGPLRATDNKVRVDLQFYSQTYRLNDSIPVRVNVMNQSDKKSVFSVSPLTYETFFFEIKTPRNENVSIRDDFRIAIDQSASSPKDYRTFELDPYESFSRELDLTKWFDIKDSGYYYIRGIFYPNPDDSSKKEFSTYYKILVKPPKVVEEKLSKDEQKHQQLLTEIKNMPPYDAISDFIDAKIKKDWDRFLLHVDAERLIEAFQNYAREYHHARSGKYRLEVLDRFKRYLTVYWKDRILSYNIKKTVIEGEKSQVTVDVEYKIRNLSYSMRYDFKLYKNHDSQWLIYDYEAVRIK